MLLDKLKRYWADAPVVGPLLLYLLPLPLIPAIVIALARGNFVNFITALAALVALYGGAWLTRHGIKREVEMERLGWSRIRAWPWKSLGALGAGVATGSCSFFIIGHSGWSSTAVALTTLAGVLLCYGGDSLGRWGRRTPFAARDREVAEALQEARFKIDSIDQANRHIHNMELRRRIQRINNRAMDILTIIAEDPVTLRRARKFLKVYLDGAGQVIEDYSRVQHDQRQGKLQDNFRNVLITIEDTFAEQQRKLQEKDLLDLDVKIEVLTTQLRDEGVI